MFAICLALLETEILGRFGGFTVVETGTREPNALLEPDVEGLSLATGKGTMTPLSMSVSPPGIW